MAKEHEPVSDEWIAEQIAYYKTHNQTVDPEAHDWGELMLSALQELLLRRSEDKPKPKFAVGDAVVLQDDLYAYGGLSGVVVRVVEMDMYRYDVDVGLDRPVCVREDHLTRRTP